MNRCILLLLAVGACRGEPAPVANAVDSATRAFASAQRARDAEQIVAHLAPEFYMYADGQRLDYATVTDNIRREFRSVRHAEPGFTDIEVAVQGPDAAVASFRFRDSVVTADGTLRRATGVTSLAWCRRGSRWLIVYADADHEVVR